MNYKTRGIANTKRYSFTNMGPIFKGFYSLHCIEEKIGWEAAHGFQNANVCFWNFFVSNEDERIIFSSP